MATKKKVDTLSGESFEFKAEMKQLLHLIIHSLYTHPDVFLRELVSNSSDAINKVRFLKLTDHSIIDGDAELKIKISLDKENGTFTLEDTGIGMNKEELMNNLGTIARSGTLDFLTKVKENKGAIDGELIGQFGVGFYSVYMVTDEITVETLRADQGSKSYKWVSKGESDFTIAESDKSTRGTKISFKIKEEYKEFLEDWKVKSTIKKYSNFIEFPIYIGDEKVNTLTAIWQKPKDSIAVEELNEFYKFISSDFQDPLSHLHLNIEGNLNFKALIYFPQVAPPNFFSGEIQKSLQLYINKVFINDDVKELLPDYLRFVKGVIDTEDLPLNVSREVTQNSPVITKIKNVIVGKILSHLEDMATNDPEKYLIFYKAFGSIFKTGANSDYTNKDKILNLLRFESTKTKAGEFTTLKKYIEAMSEGQKEIYYLSGTSRESIEKNPNLELFVKKNYEVLVLHDPMDVFIMPYINEYEGKQFKSIDKSDIEIEKDKSENSLDSIDVSSLLSAFKEVLGDKVEDVIESKRLVSSPVSLVSGKMGLDSQYEKMMQMMDKEFSASKRILEINADNKLIQNLSNLHKANGVNLQLRNAINQLFDGAMLLEGYLKSPNDFIARMYDFMEEATV